MFNEMLWWVYIFKLQHKRYNQNCILNPLTVGLRAFKMFMTSIQKCIRLMIHSGGNLKVYINDWITCLLNV